MEIVRLMLVEETPDRAGDLSAQLKTLGYTVVATVPSARQALQWIDRVEGQESRPDLVVIDLDHSAPLKLIRAAIGLLQESHIPVLFILGSDNPHRTPAPQSPEDPFTYLRHPFTAPELESSISLALHRHRLERQIENNERMFHAIMDEVAEGIIMADAKGRITYMNRTAQKLTGWRFQVAQGKPQTQVYRVQDNVGRPLTSLLGTVLSKGEKVNRRGPIGLNPYDGDALWVCESALPVHDDRHEIIGAITVFRRAPSPVLWEAQNCEVLVI